MTYFIVLASASFKKRKKKKRGKGWSKKNLIENGCT